MREFRFSYDIFGLGSREEFVETCRRGEHYGCDEFDHAEIAWEPFGAVEIPSRPDMTVPLSGSGRPER